MQAFIPAKLSVLLLACAWLLSAATVPLLERALAGPRLGALYDFLLALRPSPPVFPQILLLETDEVAEPGDVFTVLLTLSELGASDLLIEVPVLGTRAVIAESPEDFVRRVDGEFYLMERNIRSLFDGIRLGFVAPEEAPGLVESLVELSGRGRDRLNAAVMLSEEEGDARMGQAAAAFSNVLIAPDLRAAPWMPGEPAFYSRPRPDRDGRVRRIAPFVPLDDLNVIRRTPGATPEYARHIAELALARRWSSSEIEREGRAAVLVNRFAHSGSTGEFRFQLDGTGAILVERPAAPGFRRIGLSAFAEYRRADARLAALLEEGWGKGIYALTAADRIPAILFEHAENLRERMLEQPGPQTRAAWIAARDDYVRSLEAFLYGPYEMAIVNAHEQAIAGAAGTVADTAAERRDAAILAFVAMRQARRELAAGRDALAAELAGAFVIMYPAGRENGSALMANTLLTGRGVTPVQRREALLWSLGAVFLLLTAVTAAGAGNPLPGIAAAALCLAGFSLAFVVTGRWLDPALPAAAVLAGSLFMSATRHAVVHLSLRKFYSHSKAGETWAEFYFGSPPGKRG